MLADKLLFHFLLVIFQSFNSLIEGTKEPPGSYSLKLLGSGHDPQLPVSPIIMKEAMGTTGHAMLMSLGWVH